MANQRWIMLVALQRLLQEELLQVVLFLRTVVGLWSFSKKNLVKILLHDTTSLFESVLQEERENRRRRNYMTIQGSSNFHIAIYVPHSNQFKASARLCMCKQCMISVGSCSLFTSYELQVEHIATPLLRGEVLSPPEIVGEEEVNEFINAGTYVAVPAPKSCVDSFWIIKVVEVNRIRSEKSIDSFGH